MKVESIAVCRFNGDTPEPVILDIAHNLAEYGYFQKGAVKEFLNFATRTLAKRLPGGSKQLPRISGITVAAAAVAARVALFERCISLYIFSLSYHFTAGMHCVEYQGKICFAVVLAEGLQAIAVCDKEYPSRVALAMLKDLVNEVKSGELS